MSPAFNLQWHLTERCNLRCAHCYQEHHQGPEVELERAQQVIGQLEALLDRRSRDDGVRWSGRLTLTGGEPLAWRGLFPLLELARERGLKTAVLTNGTLVDDAAARALAASSVGYVQVSVEGSPQTHDRIRGAGSHAAAVRGLEALRRAGLRTVISFTAHRLNWREFSHVTRLGRALGVDRVWADRLVPLGQGAQGDLSLGPAEAMALFESMRAERRRLFRGRTEIAMHRALQFLAGGGRPYRCTAGDSLLALLPDGTALPCRRMPEPLGNVFETPLESLWREHPLLRRLREARCADGCQGCFYQSLCRGGLRCLSWAARGDPLLADPGCPRAAAPASIAERVCA
jgi:radical SAM protein with 4Fe4S-binding SPASM domain